MSCLVGTRLFMWSGAIFGVPKCVFLLPVAM